MRSFGISPSTRLIDDFAAAIMSSLIFSASRVLIVRVPGDAEYVDDAGDAPAVVLMELTFEKC